MVCAAGLSLGARHCSIHLQDRHSGPLLRRHAIQGEISKGATKGVELIGRRPVQVRFMRLYCNLWVRSRVLTQAPYPRHKRFLLASSNLPSFDLPESVYMKDLLTTADMRCLYCESADGVLSLKYAAVQAGRAASHIGRTALQGYRANCKR